MIAVGIMKGITMKLCRKFVLGLFVLGGIGTLGLSAHAQDKGLVPVQPTLTFKSASAQAEYDRLNRAVDQALQEFRDARNATDSLLGGVTTAMGEDPWIAKRAALTALLAKYASADGALRAKVVFLRLHDKLSDIAWGQVGAPIQAAQSDASALDSSMAASFELARKAGAGNL